MNRSVPITQQQMFRRCAIVTIYLLVFTVAEELINLSLAEQGLVMHCFLLLALLLHAALLRDEVEQHMLLALTLAPLIRLVSLSLPLSNIPVIFWFVIIGIPLFVASFVAARTMNISNENLGLTKKALVIQIPFGLIGLVLGWLDYQIFRQAPLATSPVQILLAAIILLIFTGFLEELILRGVIRYALTDALGGAGIFYLAILSAMVDANSPSSLNLLFGFVVALLFGIFVYRTGSILGVSLAHGILNIACYLIFPLIAAPAAGILTSHQYQMPHVIAGSPNGSTVYDFHNRIDQLQPLALGESSR